MSKSSTSSNSTKFKNLFLIGIAILVLVGAAAFYLKDTGLRHMAGNHHGADGTGHDEVNMPGLVGEDATAAESEELAIMFRNFEKISRTVTVLPNGISTITFSKDEELMGVIQSHAVGMVNRLSEGRDPKVIIQSKTLDILFERREKIVTKIETTPKGVVVIQTSDDPEVVAALQTHAAEVTGMANRGMEAVHETLMRQGR